MATMVASRIDRDACHVCGGPVSEDDPHVGVAVALSTSHKVLREAVRRRLEDYDKGGTQWDLGEMSEHGDPPVTFAEEALLVGSVLLPNGCATDRHTAVVGAAALDVGAYVAEICPDCMATTP
jgi:hypothetical protein